MRTGSCQFSSLCVKGIVDETVKRVLTTGEQEIDLNFFNEG